MLVSAYACEPGYGSEPGIGWNVVRGLASQHQVWVITRTANRARVEQELALNPVPNLHFVYYDLPRWARFWKRGNRGVQIYYYLWQLRIKRVAKRLHDDVGFDVAQHVTLGRYWSPSFLSQLPIPFVWGPVGGGESAPACFWADFSWRGRLFELLRDAARWVGAHDPFVRRTAKACTLALATTRESADKLRALGAQSVEVFCQVGLPSSELLAQQIPERTEADKIRFLSIGRLLHWKGVHLGLRAFARAGIPNAEFWIVGDGPERKRLEALTDQLGIRKRVHFCGAVSREEVLRIVTESHVLVHPSLHDSGGWVCLEAMAAGLPVVCLDLGGPATMVTEEVGIKVPAVALDQTLNSLAKAIHQLGTDSALRKSMGTNAREAVIRWYSWEYRAGLLSDILRRVSKGR